MIGNSEGILVKGMLAVLVLAGMLANVEAQTNGSPTASTQVGELVRLHGKGIYVEVSGPAEAPVLLYLHGGPGAGSYDFTTYQRERLSRYLRLVVIDQRGVLRSDTLAEDEALRLQDIIEDCEALRKHLGVKRWSVLGHSFGGYVAVRYALTYPKSVEKLLLENPTFDLASSQRSLLRGAAAEYRAAGRPEMAEECLKAVKTANSARALWEDTIRLTSQLGAQRNNLYVHGAEKDCFEQLMAQSPTMIVKIVVA